MRTQVRAGGPRISAGHGTNRGLSWIVPLLVSGLLLGCGATYPRQDPTGTIFPSVEGTRLDQRTLNIPEELAGQPALLLVAYRMRSQFDCDRWLLGVVQSGTEIAVYEVPTIDGMIPGMFAGSIDSGMRSGIPPEDWATVVTVYDDADKITQFLGNENDLPARVVLLDGDGRVVFFHDEGFSVRVLGKLQAAIQALRPAKS